jgi:hypothetical protein
MFSRAIVSSFFCYILSPGNQRQRTQLALPIAPGEFFYCFFVQNLSPGKIGHGAFLCGFPH